MFYEILVFVISHVERWTVLAAVGQLRSDSIGVPQFQTAERHWIRLDADFIKEHLVGLGDSRQVADTDATDRSYPMTSTRLMIKFPRLLAVDEFRCHVTCDTTV